MRDLNAAATGTVPVPPPIIEPGAVVTENPGVPKDDFEPNSIVKSELRKMSITQRKARTKMTAGLSLDRTTNKHSHVGTVMADCATGILNI